jgi:signal transduction histidine kinase
VGKKKPFKVSARTARLIGRENVSNADGALIELVKNAYDADSPACILLFDVIYEQVPSNFEAKGFLALLESADEAHIKMLKKCYELTDSSLYRLKVELEKDDVDQLEYFFKSKNSLFIIDSGDGMTEEVIDQHWMTIGTNHKLKDIFTSSGRVKSGAKGIGRFALDRLGTICNMVTFPKGTKVHYDWVVNWEDFDLLNATIGEINADFEEVKDGNYRQEIVRMTHSEKVAEIIEKHEDRFQNGTLLHIRELRDWWTKREMDNLFNSLQNLSPPADKQKFEIHLFNKAYPDDFGKVNNEEFKDFDYKLTAHVSADKTVEIIIEREEFQYNRVDKDLFKRPQMKLEPYDEDTFKLKKYKINTSVNELLPWLAKSELKDEADQLSEFHFVFYFSKQAVTESDKERFFYKGFNRLTRTDWFRKFGGIKIYRDNFRVRPYGEQDNTAFDWLLLGDRQAKSPAAITKKGAGWRVGPNQVAGVVSISRLANLKFEDKSSREGFQENETFSVFKDLILAIINEFEFDRHTIMREMDLLFRQKQEEAEARQKAEELLEKEREEQERRDNQLTDESESDVEPSGEQPPDPVPDYKDERDAYKKAFEAVKSDLEDAEEEVRILSALATTGLIVTSFAHEFSSFQWRLARHTNYMEKELLALLDKEKIDREYPAKRNPFLMLEKLRATHLGINQWLNIALAAVRKDKRLSDNIDFKQYMGDFEASWDEVLKTRKVILETKTDIAEELKIHAYIIDIDSIFNNLLVNSFDAFDVEGFVESRKVTITLDVYDSQEEDKKYLQIVYKDTGPGLNKKINNPNLILRRGYTTKVDKGGNEIGTGLGMWLVNDAVTYYGGTIKIERPEVGFEVNIHMPFNEIDHE